MPDPGSGPGQARSGIQLLLVPGFRRDDVWIPAGVYPVPDTGRNDDFHIYCRRSNNNRDRGENDPIPLVFHHSVPGGTTRGRRYNLILTEKKSALSQERISDTSPPWTGETCEIS